VILRYYMNTDKAGKFDFTVAGNANQTRVSRIPTTAVLTALNPAPPLFDRVNRLTLEEGTPSRKLSATTDWNMTLSALSLGASLKGTYYGEVTEPGLPASTTEDPTLRDLVLDPTVLVDIDLHIKFLKDKLTFSVGADNLFDQYPNRTPIARANPAGGTINLNSTNALAFSRYSPYGFSGRFVYLRTTYNW
jgi:iron complex outermembrane receptor protein